VAWTFPNFKMKFCKSRTCIAELEETLSWKDDIVNTKEKIIAQL